jgi:hypothetical protein
MAVQVLQVQYSVEGPAAEPQVLLIQVAEQVEHKIQATAPIV